MVAMPEKKGVWIAIMRKELDLEEASGYVIETESHSQ
jgi:hypothetical protein